MSLKDHRINSIKEYNLFKSVLNDNQKQYNKAVFDMIDNLPFGSFFDIEKNVPEVNRRIFMKCVCCYILEQDTTAGHIVEISDDYLYIRRR